jgi:NAD(P)-dependent dehydrogenase (short-subunit alcohol dehydrogenase family)
MPQHLEGKTAIVTGSGRGIGRGIALAMAAQGASVVVNDFGGSVEGEGRDTSVAQQVVDEITNAGGTAIVNGADVSDHREAEDLVRQALNEFGALDILVNVAGILRERMIFNMTEQEWDDVIRVHLKGTYNTTHFASIHWRQRREYGRLINFSSTAGINGSAGQPNYAAAKAGLIGFTKGVAESESVDGSDRDPGNVAPIVVYLASEAGANISGRTIGASGFQVQLYSDMHVERQIFSDGPWDIDKLFERAPDTIFAGLEAPSGDRPAGATVSDA